MTRVLTMRLRLPETKRFSSMHPSGMSMRWPSFATTGRAHASVSPQTPQTCLIRTDDGAPQGDVAAKVDVAGDGEMVELDDLGDLLEALLELLDLLWWRYHACQSRNSAITRRMWCNSKGLVGASKFNWRSLTQ